MLAQLCNPVLGRRRFKLQPPAPAAQEGHRKAVRRHSWSSLNVENDAVVNAADPREDSASDDDEENRSQGPDLLRPCWDVKGGRDDDCQSEPGTEPVYDSIESMGQRASSTASLHEPLRRPPPPGVVLPPGSKVSLTWALLKNAKASTPVSVSSHHYERSSPLRPDFVAVRPEVLRDRRQSHTIVAPVPQRPSTHSSSRTSSQSTSRTNSSSSNSRSSGSIKNFGYEIQDIDEFLSKASLQSPANIPVVLSSPCVLYQPGTRRSKSGRGWRQNEIALSLGMVVNAVFRSHNWLYVHTPHGEAGYVRYRACLPLGILPSPAASAPGTPAPGAWDTHTDAFPPPPLPVVSRGRRSGTASVFETRRDNKTDNEKLRDTVSECGGSGHRSRHRHRHRAQRPEAAVDRLFLAAQRSESESARHRRPRSTAESLLKDAELSSRRFRAESTVSVKDSVSQVGVRCPKPKYPDKIKDYQYQIEQNLNNLKPMHRTIALQTDFDDEDCLIKDSVSEVGRFKKPNSDLSRSRGAMSECGVKSKRSSRAPSALSEVQMKTETLLLIRSDYNSRGRNTLSVSKGDVVVLVSSRLKDWFWVRRTDGCEGFIPAVVAGHGFL